MIKKYLYLFLILILISCSNYSIKDRFFVNNYEPFVILTSNESISSVVILIEEMNLKYQIYNPIEPYTDNAFGVITIGEYFPVEKFIEILKFIRNYYPDLRYIQLTRKKQNIPEKNLYSLFIANSTEIAIKNNLKALNDNDFKSLISLKSTDEIHNFILKFHQEDKSISRPTGQ